MKKKLLFTKLFLVFSIAINAQLFNQNFSSSVSVSDYISGTPDSGQFDYISLISGNFSTSITNSELEFDRTICESATPCTSVVSCF